MTPSRMHDLAHGKLLATVECHQRCIAAGVTSSHVDTPINGHPSAARMLYATLLRWKMGRAPTRIAS